MTKSGVRITAQDRSANRQRQIADAALQVIAKHGLAGVTHRLVAKTADVSLAATTYYYRTKSDIIVDAARQLQETYLDDMKKVAEQCRQGPDPNFRDFVIHLVTARTGRHKQRTLAWCEIVLGAVRQPELQVVTRASERNLVATLSEIAESFGVEKSRETARSAMDIVIGLNFAILALDVGPDRVRSVLNGKSDAFDGWKPKHLPRQDKDEGDTESQTTRALRTRDRILDAAIDLLISGGPSAVTFRSVAEKLGLTAAAPTHHFPKLDLLLAATHERLFSLSEVRHRHNISPVEYRYMDRDTIVDVTATVLVLEATQYGALSTASYTLWLEAARRPELRDAIWRLFAEQCEVWRLIVARVVQDPHCLDPVILQALFRGKVIRMLSTGSRTEDLSRAHRQFAFDVSNVLAGTHWMIPRT